MAVSCKPSRSDKDRRYNFRVLNLDGERIASARSLTGAMEQAEEALEKNRTLHEVFIEPIPKRTWRCD